MSRLRSPLSNKHFVLGIHFLNLIRTVSLQLFRTGVTKVLQDNLLVSSFVKT